MGLKVGEVRLEQHNDNWELMFAKEVEELWEYFGDVALRISHIGSTAVDGLEAKPIIDIAIAVNDLSDFDSVSEKFVDDPDYSIKKGGDPDEILIRKGPEKNRSYYIHVMDIDSKRYKNTIVFRDTLLSDERIRNDYRALKHHLAEKYPNNRKKYTSSKADFIDTTLDMVWARTPLMPLAVITCVMAVTFGLSLWARLTFVKNPSILGLPLFNICHAGMFIGAGIGIVCLGATIVLLVRYIQSSKRYNRIVAKIPKRARKEA